MESYKDFYEKKYKNNFYSINRSPYRWFSNYVKLKMIKKFIKRVGNKGTLLDAGGGLADWSYLFLNQFKKVIVLDISKTALKLIPEKEIIKKQGSVTKIPLKSNSADCILLIDVFEHIHKKDLLKMLREMERVLKEGGLVIIYTSHYGWGIRLAFNRLLGRLNGRLRRNEVSSSGHVNRMKLSEIRELVRMSSLEIEDYCYYSHFFQPLTEYPKDIVATIIDSFMKVKKVRKGQGIKDDLNKRRVLPNSMKMVFSLLSKVSYLDVFFFGKAIPGDTIFFTLRKPPL